MKGMRHQPARTQGEQLETKNREDFVTHSNSSSNSNLNALIEVAIRSLEVKFKHASRTRPLTGSARVRLPFQAITFYQ